MNTRTTLPLTSLFPAVWNPRGSFGDDSVSELVESVRAQGVLTPLLVRPTVVVNGHVAEAEIVAGHRRYRAAQLAGLQDVPVTVREMTDDQAREVAIVENLQRADVHPLDEARGFDALLKTTSLTLGGLAARVGKSPSYISQRLALCDLCDVAAAAFREGDITLGHAQLLARLEPADQAKALNVAMGPERGTDDLPAAVRQRNLMTVDALARWIRNQVLQDLSAAIWPLDDADVLAGEPACLVCPKRGGLQEGLFDEPEAADGEAGWCADGGCFARKRDAWLGLLEHREGLRSGLEVVRVSTDFHGKVPKGVLRRSAFTEIPGTKAACDHTRLALVVHGFELGSTFRVCVGQTCKAHGRQPVVKATSGYADKASRDEAEAKRKQVVQARKASRVALMRQCLARAAWPLPNAVLAMVAESLLDDIGRHEVDGLLDPPGWTAMDIQVVRLLLLRLVSRDLDGWDEHAPDLDAVVTALKVTPLVKAAKTRPTPVKKAAPVKKIAAIPAKAKKGAKKR